MQKRKRIYRIKFYDGYIIEWSWEGDDEWFWYDETWTFWGAKWKIRKAEKELAEPITIGIFNEKGKRID